MASANFLPAINTNTGMQGTGMSAIRTGQSFMNSRNIAYQAKVGVISPTRSLSITEAMSPRDMVRQFTKRGQDEFGIEGYIIPKVDSPRKKQMYGYIPRNNMPGPIVSEMNFRRNYPGAAQYDLPIEKNWSEQAGKKGSKPDFTKSPRSMMGDIIGRNNEIPEKSTPSPQVYEVNKEKILPRLDRGGAALLQAKASKVTIFEEAMARGGDVPGPDKYETIDTGIHKKRASAVLFAGCKSPRLEPLKRNESTDFYETENAAKRTTTKSPSAQFLKGKKISFAHAAAAKNKVPGAGTYKISDKAYKMLSPSPGARKR